MDNNICAIVEYEYAAKEPDELDLQKGAIIHRIKQMPGGWWQGTLKSSGTTGMFPDNFVRVLESGISSNGNGTTGSGDHIDEATAVQLRDKSATSNRRCKVIYSYTQVNDDELTLAVGDVIEFLGEVEEGWWRGRLRSKVGVFPSNFVQHIEPSPILASKRPPTIGATVTTSSLTSKAANVANVAATSTVSTGGGGTSGTTGTTNNSTAKQATKSRVNTAGSSAPAETAAIVSGSVSGSGAASAAPAVVPMLPPKPQREFCRVEFPYAPQNDDELELKVDDIITVITTELPDKGWWKGEIRGKVGVFPDNFVKMLAPSEVAPINEPPTTTTQPQNQRKISNTASTASHMTTTNSSNSSSTTSVTTQQQKEQIGSTTSKVYIKKTGSSSNSTTSSTTTASSSAGRKESFGSRDSLNDILSETGLPTGNVAAQRKSLENKNLDLTKPPGVGASVVAIGQQRSSTSSATTTTSSSATTISTGLTSSSVSKSMENMLDEKVKSPPPPVLSKKPSVPLKKTPTGGVPVAGNLLGGKQKKNPEGKLTTAVSHDLADGLTASKMLSGANQLPESGAAGNVVIRRAATIAVEDTDFDRVERSSILTDMRQGRVKAPKRRPPSAAINVLGESNNNSVYVNGSGMAGGGGSASELSEDGGAGGKTSDDNSTGEEPQLAKPKPREWEKKKAPWMEELKASQVTRKKTSPSVEPRGASVAERASKLFAAEQAISSSSSSTTTKVQSSAVTSSMFVENSTTSSSVTTSSTSSTTTNDAIMSRSLTAAAKQVQAVSSDEETRATRPNSLAIRNQRSVSPLVKSSNASSSQSQEEKEKEKEKPASNQLNNHQDASSTRVAQLEQRVDKLEGLVLNQQRTIEELVNALKSEAERVKILRSELDKYAQCVTQV
ncbi:platelet binding protein GspB isoform X1 [Drosophila takahashii]|uniref:platelet binding protein GspB isoform X1 n=2 Tax=Drosophila takahashii TaxID=29030 RepID=UPI001CF8A5C3|nr:SH3 domain-containing kinase-binding protein 1 isoform X1 [Drosophila takahashii]